MCTGLSNISICEVGVLVPSAECWLLCSQLRGGHFSGLSSFFYSGKQNEQLLPVVSGPPGRCPETTSAVPSPHGDVLRTDVLFCWIDEKIVKK